MSWRRVLVVAAIAMIPAQSARGDWPVGRHDAQRTGAAEGASDILIPELRWSYYLGGSLTSNGADALDVDGDGVVEFVMVAGGALVARGLDDQVVWKVPPRGITGITGNADLDGDGDREIVTTAARGVIVVDAATGAVEWESPVDLVGLLGGVRMADLDGDQLDDLLILPCGPCCAVSSTWPGAAYGFAGGVSQPTELWQLTQPTCGRDFSLTLFDADGDGGLEVLVAGYTDFQLLDGATGTELGRTAALGTAMQFAVCAPVDVDGKLGDELACLHNDAYYVTDRSAFVVGWDGATLDVRWRTFLANAPTEQLRAVDLVADLGAGARVLVATRSDDDRPWTTLVLDAATGTEVARLDDELVGGTAPNDGDGHYLLTANASGLSGWREAGGELTRAWRRATDEEPLLRVDRAAARRGSVKWRATVLPSTGRLLVVPRSSVNTLRAISYGDTGTGLEAEVFMALNVRVAASFVFEDLVELPLAVARSDGYLTPFDEELLPQLGADDVQLPGIRTGGYYAPGSFRQLGGPPRTADLDGDGRDEVLTADARGALVRIDPHDAGLVVPPTPTWVLAEATAPALIVGPGVEPSIACVRRDTADPFVPMYTVTVVDPDGNERWSTPLPGSPMADLVHGLLDDDAVPDVVAQWGSADNVLLHTVALSGVDGATIWDEVSAPGSGRAPAGVSVGPWPGEPRDVVAYVGASRATVRSGATGAVVAQSPLLGPDVNYFLPSLVNIDADPAPEIALTGGYHPITLLDDDLAPVYTGSDAAQRPFPYGAIARCAGDTYTLVSQSFQHPSLLTISTISPIGRGTETRLWLGGGGAYVSEELMTGAGVWGGQLTSATVHADLTGTGRAVGLVGSTDGHLYVVDPCYASFLYALEFDSAVGEAVFGDTDGDGKDEILVTVGDGMLYAVQNRSIAAPALVYDHDVVNQGSADIDELDVGLPLAARWDPVDGAIGYEAAVVDRTGRYITTPAWQRVDAPEVTLDAIDPVPGETYRMVVRTVGPDGRSTDVASDGVTVVDRAPPPDPIGGCCDGGRGETGAGALALLVVLGLRRPARGRIS